MSLWCQNITEARSVSPSIGVKKRSSPFSWICVFSVDASVNVVCFCKGKTEGGVWWTCTLAVPCCAKPCSPLRWPWAHAPAVQTQPDCWAHINVLAEPNPIICLKFFWFHFSSAYSATLVYLIYAARLKKANKYTTMSSLSSIILLWKCLTACQLNFPAFYSVHFWFDQWYPSPFKGEQPKSTLKGCESLRHWHVNINSRQRSVFVRKEKTISKQSVMLCPLTCGASGQPPSLKIITLDCNLDFAFVDFCQFGRISCLDQRHGNLF